MSTGFLKLFSFFVKGERGRREKTIPKTILINYEKLVYRYQTIVCNTIKFPLLYLYQHQHHNAALSNTLSRYSRILKFSILCNVLLLNSRNVKKIKLLATLPVIYNVLHLFEYYLFLGLFIHRDVQQQWLPPKSKTNRSLKGHD